MKKKVHPIASVVAMLCIASFFTSSALIELFGSHTEVAMVKKLIVVPGLFILIPALAITGITGFALAKNRRGRLVDRKLKRMPFIAANGIFILVPCAIFLDQWASSGLYDSRFYVVQAVELLAGGVNLTLMSMNMRDGLMMAGRLQRKKQIEEK